MKTLIIATILSTLSLPAFASDYGCQILLCLSNPASNGGPKGIPECVPPINQLYDDLDHGKPFPTCDVATSSYTVNDPFWQYYHPLPQATVITEF